jgi:hypothetical protein
MILEMGPEAVRDIYRRIHSGENPRGEFLTAFATAVVLSTEEEFALLAAPAAAFILRYRLHEPGAQQEDEVISEGN